MIRTIVPPLVEPITVAQAFAELRLDAGDDIAASPDYEEVRSLIREAREACEDLAGCAFVRQTLRYYPAPERRGSVIALPRRPLVGVVRVGYYDGENVEQQIDATNYYAPALEAPALHLAVGYSLPALYPRPDALYVDYIVGYEPLPNADPDDPQYLASGVPEVIKRAIRLTLRLLYQSLDPREHEMTAKARDTLLFNSPAKVWTL